jgi:hypothetical protein
VEEEEAYVQQPIKSAITNLEKKSSITIKRVESNRQTSSPQPKHLVRRLENGKVVIVQQQSSPAVTKRGSESLIINSTGPRILNACAPSTPTTSTVRNTASGYQLVKKPDGSYINVAKTSSPIQVVKSVASSSDVRRVPMKQTIQRQVVSISKTPTTGRVMKPANTASGQKMVIHQGGKTIVASPSSGMSTQKIIMSQSELKAAQASGEIQAVNIPGKGVQYVRLLKKESSPKPVARPVPSPAKKISTPLSKQIQSLGGNAKIVAVVKKDGATTDDPKINSLTTSQLNQLTGATVISGANNTKIVMLPSDYADQLKNIQARKSTNITPSKIASEIDAEMERLRHGTETDGYKKRACNCTKSQCLKLYCDCFANGEFCYNCNCKDCFNNLENEDERQKAIRATLERNPSAFK